MLPKLDSKIFNIYYSSVLGITISLHAWFCCARTKEKFSHWKVMMDWRWRLFCISAAYCQMFERGELWKLRYFNSALTKTKKHIWSRKLLAMARKKGKNLNFFLEKQHFNLLQVWAFDVFYLLDNTLSIGVFTLTKLMFETKAAKLWQRGVMDWGKKCLWTLFNTWTQFFHPIAYFEKGPMKPGVMTFILQNL